MVLNNITDATLNKAIKYVALVLGVVIIVGVGMAIYQAIPSNQLSPAVRDEITTTQAAITKDPTDADAHVKLASIYISEGMYSDAQTELDKALKINGNHMAALQLMGTVFERDGNTAKAVTYYKKAISLGEKTEFKSLNPYLYEAIYRLGKIYVDENKNKQAIDVLEKGVAINSIDSDLRYVLGLAYLQSNQTDKAISEFETALKYVPDFAEAYFALGRAYEKKGDKAQAKAAYQKAVANKTNYTQAEEALKKLK